MAGLIKTVLAGLTAQSEIIASAPIGLGSGGNTRMSDIVAKPTGNIISEKPLSDSLKSQTYSHTKVNPQVLVQNKMTSSGSFFSGSSLLEPKTIEPVPTTSKDTSITTIVMIVLGFILLKKYF